MIVAVSAEGRPQVHMQRGINLEGHRPRCPRVLMFHAFDVAGCDKPARPPALQVHMSRVRWRAGGLAGRRYKCFDVVYVEGRSKPAGRRLD